MSENMALATGEAHITGKSEKGDPIKINAIWTVLTFVRTGNGRFAC